MGTPLARLSSQNLLLSDDDKAPDGLIGTKMVTYRD
jgi:hypothetical protein